MWLWEFHRLWCLWDFHIAMSVTCTHNNIPTLIFLLDLVYNLYFFIQILLVSSLYILSPKQIPKGEKTFALSFKWENVGKHYCCKITINGEQNWQNNLYLLRKAAKMLKQLKNIRQSWKMLEKAEKYRKILRNCEQNQLLETIATIAIKHTQSIIAT